MYLPDRYTVVLPVRSIVYLIWQIDLTDLLCVLIQLPVGYGDICPTTASEKLFTCAFAFVGVGFIGASLGVVMDGVVSREDEIRNQVAKGIFKHNERRAQVVSTLLVSILQIGAFLLTGTFIFSYLESTSSLLDAFYFACITTTTVGYGDLAMTTDLSKCVAIVYLILGTVLVAKALGDIAALPLDIQRQRREHRVLTQFGEHLSASELIELTDGKFMKEMGLHESTQSDACTRNEFILAMLLRLEKVSKQDLAACRVQFDKLDADGSGTLDRNDVRLHSAALASGPGGGSGEKLD